jgi:hypothetical protein
LLNDQAVQLCLSLIKHNAMKMYGRAEVIAPPFLTSALDGCELSPSGSRRFAPEERAPGTHCTERWMGSRAGLQIIKN